MYLHQSHLLNHIDHHHAPSSRTNLHLALSFQFCIVEFVSTSSRRVAGLSVSSLRVSSSDHSSHRHTRRSPPPYSATIFCHHNTPPPPSYRDTDAVVRVRGELLFPSYFFLLSFFIVFVLS